MMLVGRPGYRIDTVLSRGALNWVTWSYRRRELKPLHTWHHLSWFLFGSSPYMVLVLVVIFMTSLSSSKTDFIGKTCCVFVLERLPVYLWEWSHTFHVWYLLSFQQNWFQSIRSSFAKVIAFQVQQDILGRSLRAAITGISGVAIGRSLRTQDKVSGDFPPHRKRVQNLAKDFFEPFGIALCSTPGNLPETYRRLRPPETFRSFRDLDQSFRPKSPARVFT